MRHFWTIALICVLAGCKEMEEQPERVLLAEIQALYQSGRYGETLDSIMALRERYPKAVEECKEAGTIWQDASLQMAQADITRTDSALQATLRQLSSLGSDVTAKGSAEEHRLRVRRDSLSARYEAMCAVVRMIHLRQERNKQTDLAGTAAP